MKQTRNLDGLVKPKITFSGSAKPKPAAPPRISIVIQQPRRQVFSWKKYILANRAAFVSALGVVIAFGLGVGYAASTRRTAAETQPITIPAATAAASEPIPLAPAPEGLPVPKDAIFNTPLELLKSYLSSAEPDIVAIRKDKLRQFLKQYKSPLAAYADTVAEQEHWKLILAISFAESTLCTRQVDNNCSGIGVEPGHPLWRKYETLGDWAVDLNRLLDKRYKGDTLEQMCGVYVQPCNANWLIATKQILTELEEQGID